MARKTGWGPFWTPPLPSYDALMAAYPWSLWWKLNESGGGTAHDSSGNGRNGSYGNGMTYGIAGPRSGDTAVSLPGNAGITSSWAPSSIAAFTAIVWYNGIPGYWAPALMATNDVYHNGTGMMLLLGLLTNLTLQTFGYNGNAKMSNVLSSDSSWHMLTLTAQAGGNGIIYEDGVSINSAGAPGSLSPSGLWLQVGQPYGADSCYTGPVAQAAFGDGFALTAAQIAALFAGS